MTIDFSTITIYELLALILAIVALLIPIVPWAWKKWMVKPELKHISTGSATLFFNRCGSYIRVDGVYQANNKPITIEEITIKIIREKDESVLKLRWNNIISPISQNIVGNFALTTVVAHPFRIEADSVVSSFMEFADFSNSTGKEFQPHYDLLIYEAKKASVLSKQYDQAYSNYVISDIYKKASSNLEQYLFWKGGKYKVILTAKFEKTSVDFHYKFEVTNEDYKMLLHNISEVLAYPLKEVYNEPPNFNAVQVEITKNEK